MIEIPQSTRAMPARAPAPTRLSTWTSVLIPLRTLTVLLTVTVSICFVSNLAAQIPRNPEFDNATSWWFGFGNETEIAIANEGYESDKSCLVSNRSEYWQGVAQNLLGDLQPGTDYHFQARVKTTGGATDLRLCIQQTDDRGETYFALGDVAAVDTEWRLLQGGFRYQENGVVTGLNLIVNGILDDPNTGSFLVDSVSITENNWRADADARIELHRKRDVEVALNDASGQSVTDVTIGLQQIDHSFAFGCTLNDQGLLNPEYTDFFKQNFSWGTIEWFAQWRPVEFAQGVLDYSKADESVQFAIDNGINLRGHALFWGPKQFRPDWLEDLSSEELFSAMEQRVDGVVSRYKGDLVHWDVNNEMIHNSYFADRLDLSIRPWMFTKARENDPDVKLFLNETAVHRSTRITENYRELVQGLLADGADVGGIGIQGHFFQGNTSPKKLEIALEKLTDLGPEVWFSEFDVSNPDPIERGAALEDFYRYAFSIPEVKGIIMWGFWAGSHWQGPDASLVDLDGTVNAAGQAYLDLIDSWTTTADGVLDAENPVISFRGFHGSYLAEVTDQETGQTNWHLFDVAPSTMEEPQSVQLVESALANTLVVYGTEADDLIEFDAELPRVFKVNGVSRRIPLLADVQSIRFQGLGGNDRLVIKSSPLTTRTRIWDSKVLDFDSGFEVRFTDVESVEVIAGAEDAIVNFFDSTGDDLFTSLPNLSTLTTDRATVSAAGYDHVVAKSTAGGNDTAELFDSPDVDFAYTNLDFIRYRDAAGSIRRADGFATARIVSQFGEDRINYVVPVDTNSIELSGGAVVATRDSRTFDCGSFRFSRVALAAGNELDLLLIDTADNDRLTIDVNRLTFYGPGYSFLATGVTSATAVASSSGDDLLVVRDSQGDDVAVVNSSGVTIDGSNYEFSLSGFDRVRLVGINGGENAVTVDSPSYSFGLFGSWVE